MTIPARATTPVRVVALLLLVVALAIPGCGMFRYMGIGGDEPMWSERSYKGISTSSLLQLAQTSLRDRYPVQNVDLYRGTLESQWVYGRFEEHTHKAIRARVMIETETEGDVVKVKLRVQQEASPSAGRSGEAEVDDWELTADDPGEAKRMLQRLHVLARDVAESVTDPAAPKGSPTPPTR